MAGGSDGGTTILETPPYIIALVFFFFLIITLSFEKILKWTRKSLEKRNKQGLLKAMTNMQNELMCLGVATLILLLFQPTITSYCVNAKHYTRTWLDHVNGCACCLRSTKGISPCYLAAKGCIGQKTLSSCCDQDEKPKVCSAIFDEQYWDVSAASGIYTVNTATEAISAGSGGDHQRKLKAEATMRALLGDASQGTDDSLLSASEVQCDGRIQTGWEECRYRPDYRPAIGSAALHHVHLFIFITAIVHIGLGIALICIASLRVRFWRKWKDSDDAYASIVQQAVDEQAHTLESADSAGQLEDQLEPTPGGLGLDKAGARGESLHPARLSDTIEIARGKPWRGRPAELLGPSPRVWEAVVCLWRQFLPNVVTREEFSIMRASFLLTLRIRSTSSFNFMDYLSAAMEADFAHVVGLGLPMWCFIIIFVILSSAIGWCIWVFIIISGFLLAVLNCKLVWIARYVTRGGQVHKLKPGIFWLNRPWLLLPVIKFLLFFVSYVYANAIFFATQFGIHSCFFSSVGFQGQAVPWWIIMLINTIFMMSLSLLTLPLYAITVQMGGDFKARLMPADVLENAVTLQNLPGTTSKGLRRLLSKAIPKERDVGKTGTAGYMSGILGKFPPNSKSSTS